MATTYNKLVKQNGLSLIEMMIAIAIGSLLMLGLTTTFQNSSETQREMERSGRLIENGRYGVDLLSSDIHHAGYFGHYFQAVSAPGTLPDPCQTTNLVTLAQAMAMPVQGYSTPAASTFTSTNCGTGGFLTATNMNSDSDVFVVRRASTRVFGSPTLESPANNRVYIQSNPRTANLLLGDSSAIVPTQAANNTAQTLRKYPAVPTNLTPADTYEYKVHTYFVAPCSFGTGTAPAGECEASDDTIPTLKKLELSSIAGNTAMEIVPLVEGVEMMRVAYGIDTTPAAINPTTGFPGDGVPDTYVTAPTLVQWPQVVAMRIYLLMRAPETSIGYTDAKQYNFPAPINLTVGPFGDAFKRHVYSAEVRPKNIAGRRE